MNVQDVVGLVERATAGEWKVRDENEGDHPRPLWVVENDAFHDWDETGAPFHAAVHYGGKEDADAIAAAVNFIRSDEFKRLVEDASRWRWLRDECDYGTAAHLMALAHDDLDAAIDAARSGNGGG